MKKFYKASKNKIVANGLFIRGGTSFGTYRESLLGFGWASERFRRSSKKYSFICELGPGLVIRHWLDEPNLAAGVENDNKVGFVIAWKFHWNSYLK